MLRPSFRLLLAGSSALASLSAQAQQAAAPASTAEAEAAAAEEAPEIEVVGQRERGSVPGDIQPEVQLNAAAIRSYGASSVTDLLDALAPQLQSARGRDGGAPVVLLNGRRVSGFAAIRDLPTEAIERVDILPEEASLRLGYRADQRVVNFVLRRRFRSEIAEVQGGGATQGDRYSASVDGTVTRIRRDKRLVVKVEYDGATPIYESDRDVATTPPSRPYAIAGNITAPTLGGEIDPRLSAIAGSTVSVAGIPESLSGTTSLAGFANPANPSYFGPYRTLSAATRTLKTNASYTQTILGDITAELTGNYEAGRTVSALGLGTATLTVPAGNPFSPFAGPVVVNRYLVEAGPRLRNVDRGAAQLGMALNGDLSPEWRWSFTGNYSRTLSRTGTDTNVDTAPLAAQILAGDAGVNPFGRYAGLGDYRQDFARSLNTNAGGDMVASGPVFTLPGGKVAASFKSGYASTSLAADATRSGVVTTSNFGRDTASAQVSVDVPIASRRTAFLDALGNLSLNGNYAIDNLSDYGRLSTIGYGVNWSPIPAIRLIFSHTDDENAPSVSQLGEPTIVTPDVRTFDYVTGQSVDITRIDGGNRGLRGEERHVTKIGGTFQPFTETNLSLTANYIRSRTDDPIYNLPAVTAEIQAAFPDRFMRDVTGRLLRVDNRPVNYDRRDTEELRWGINFSRRLGPPPPQRGPGGPGGFGGFRRPDAAGGQPAPGTAPAPEPASGTEPPAREARAGTTAPGDAGAPPQGTGPDRGFGGGRGGFGGGGGRGGFGGGGFGGGQLRLSVYHTWRFQDRITIRDGLPPLDLLNGFAFGNSGGTARHQVQAEVNATRNGYGLRLFGQWQAGTVVRGGTLSTPTDLDFSSLTTLNLRLFKNFQPTDKAARDHRWLLGTRVALDIANLTDTRLRVTDANGNVPINQQQDIRDPIGRTLLFSIRKQFF